MNFNNPILSNLSDEDLNKIIRQLGFQHPHIGIQQQQRINPGSYHGSFNPASRQTVPTHSQLSALYQTSSVPQDNLNTASQNHQVQILPKSNQLHQPLVRQQFAQNLFQNQNSSKDLNKSISDPYHHSQRIHSSDNKQYETFFHKNRSELVVRSR